MKYIDEVKRAMMYLAEDPLTLFLGQSVSYPGNVIYKTLQDIPPEKKLELPVFEEVQMGMSTGLALSGQYIPISVFPRFNFLLLAMNQLVNHLDKISYISKGGFKPKVIIKTMVGSRLPLDPGIQHRGDFTQAVKLMVDTICVEDLRYAKDVFPAYQRALERDDGVSTLLVEHGDNYHLM